MQTGSAPDCAPFSTLFKLHDHFVHLVGGNASELLENLIKKLFAANAQFMAMEDAASEFVARGM